jgi:hypothetical protein
MQAFVSFDSFPCKKKTQSQQMIDDHFYHPSWQQAEKLFQLFETKFFNGYPRKSASASKLEKMKSKKQEN